MTSEIVLLVEKIQTGSEQAARALIERFQGEVFGVCYRMLGQRQDAEDVVQEVFLRVFKHLHKWDTKRSFKPWLFTIAVNRCRTYMEKRAKMPLFNDEIIHLATSASNELQGELGEELQLALENLREEYRTAFILYHQQDLSCAEIGEVLDCPEGTIKTWLHRARKELAGWLTRRGVEAGVSKTNHPK